jgi:hypothetical protein
MDSHGFNRSFLWSQWLSFHAAIHFRGNTVRSGLLLLVVAALALLCSPAVQKIHSCGGAGSNRTFSSLFVVSHHWIALDSKGSRSSGSPIAGLPPQSKCGFRFASLRTVGPSEPTPVIQVKFFHQRHLRVVICSCNTAHFVSCMTETPPCIRSSSSSSSSTGDPSAHSCYLDSVVDTGDTSVRSWFHLGDSSIVGVVVVLAGESSEHSLFVAVTPPLYCFVPTCRRLLRAHSIVVVACLLLYFLVVVYFRFTPLLGFTPAVYWLF